MILVTIFSITKKRIGERYILYELHYNQKYSILTVNRTLNNQTQIAFCFLLKSGMFDEHKYL